MCITTKQHFSKWKRGKMLKNAHFSHCFNFVINIHNFFRNCNLHMSELQQQEQQCIISLWRYIMKCITIAVVNGWQMAEQKAKCPKNGFQLSKYQFSAFVLSFWSASIKWMANRDSVPACQSACLALSWRIRRSEHKKYCYTSMVLWWRWQSKIW